MTDVADRFAVFGFDSTHVALQAENTLLVAREDVVLIPTPHALGTLCGFALRVPLARRQLCLDALAECLIEPTGEIEMTDRR